MQRSNIECSASDPCWFDCEEMSSRDVGRGHCHECERPQMRRGQWSQWARLSARVIRRAWLPWSSAEGTWPVRREHCLRWCRRSDIIDTILLLIARWIRIRNIVWKVLIVVWCLFVYDLLYCLVTEDKAFASDWHQFIIIEINILLRWFQSEANVLSSATEFIFCLY